jgi:hypothetical protein
MSFSSIWDMHSLSFGGVEGEVSSIGAFPVMVEQNRNEGKRL